ncbi:MAG: dihydropteroate synthase [Acidimicrobiales bacterium]
MRLVLGRHSWDLSTRALVMGILNRTPDSFYDGGAHLDMGAFVERAAQLVADGADLLDVGGVTAGPGPEVTLDEELERVVPAVEALASRWEVPVSVDTWRSEVANEAFAAGAVLGNDISGFADPAYLRVASAAGASVVATHIRLAPRVPDPAPDYGDVVVEVVAYLAERAAWAAGAGLGPERVVLDAGLDLGKGPSHSLQLLRASGRLAALGHPVLVAASNKAFLGAVLGLGLGERREASLAAAAVAVMRGARLVRTHDVVGARRVCATLAAVMEAGD